MDIAVIVPFDTECPHRHRAWRWVRGHYEQLGWPTIEGSGLGDGWSKAVAVADALARSSAPILVIADADVWGAGITQAVEAVRSGAPWAVPHRQVWRLAPEATEAVLAGAEPDKHLRVIRTPYNGTVGGGIVVLTRALYEQIPLDPRFVGWGGEDRSWGYALTTLAGPSPRFGAPLWHLWHPPQPNAGRLGSAPNTTLACAYTAALNHPDEMLEIITAAARAHQAEEVT